MNESFSWSIVEYPHHERGFWWYVVAALVGGALIVYALLTQNIMFAFIVIIFALILFILSRVPPRSVVVVINDEGIMVGSRKYRWKDIKTFWMVYEPPEVKNVYFEFDAGFHSRLGLALDDIDPVPLRAFLLQYILEDTEKTEEPWSDWLGRMLKI